MKKIRKLAILATSLVLALSFGAFAACNDDSDNSDNSSSSNTESSIVDGVDPMTQPGFKFKVVDQDGNPVEGVVIQLCITTCTFSEKTNADGLVAYTGTEGEGEYDIHVFSGNPMIEQGASQLSHEGATKTPATYSDDVITLTIHR